MTVSVITADLVAILVNTLSYLKFNKSKEGTLLNIYDFFMGQLCNPRLPHFDIDLKMWAEITVSWITLFLITLIQALQF